MAAKNIQRLQPLYIPYWLYDMNASVDVRGTATRVNIYVRGETEYTETDFFDVRRKMRLEYTKVPHDASEKMDDTLMAKLEPYRFETLKTFQIPYLAGFEADHGRLSFRGFTAPGEASRWPDMLQNTPVQRFPVTQVYILTINRWIMTISAAIMCICQSGLFPIATGTKIIYLP